MKGGSFSPVKVTPRRTEHLADEPVLVTVTLLAPTLSRVVRPGQMVCLSKVDALLGTLLITYSILTTFLFAMLKAKIHLLKPFRNRIASSSENCGF